MGVYPINTALFKMSFAATSSFTGAAESPLIPFGNEKNAEREIIHGRFAMLCVTGAWAPEGSGSPSFWAVIGVEIVTMGLAEAYRTGLVDPAFDELTVGDANPGGRFDPLNLAESGDLDELKLKELKHCRLAMFAWLGCISQAVWTKEGPIANWSAHVADPVHVNSMKYAREYWTSISL